MRFPLHFEYNRDLFIPVNPLPSHININVSGNGWELFRDQLGIKLPELRLSLERPLETKRIIGATLPPFLAHQLGKLSINYVVTDTLHLHIDKRDSHRFKVTVNQRNFLYKKGFGRISPVVILPDSVLLDGPKSLLHSLPDSLVLDLTAEEADQNFNSEVEIQLPIGSENIKRDPWLVKVIFEVGPIVEIEKRLKLIKSATGYTLPDSVSVWFSIPAKHQNDFNLTSDQIKAEVKINKKRIQKMILPTILNVPAFAFIKRVDTVYLQLKNNDK